MGLLKKRRAKLVAHGRLYLWWVCPDEDSPDLLLRVVSDDRHFAVAYSLGQAAARQRPFVVVQGREFPHVEGGCWRRVVCPRWNDDATITPRFVRRLVDWCMDPEKQVALVGWGQGEWVGEPSDAGLAANGAEQAPTGRRSDWAITRSQPQ